MKNPNGYGSVVKLSQNRRKPYAVRITKGWEISGNKSVQKYTYVGYYKSQPEALIALAEYNKDPHSIEVCSITFSEVYEKWSEKKFSEIGQSNINGYKSSYAMCQSIYNTKFCELKLSHLQSVVDKANRNYPALKKLKTLFNQLFDYAVQNEIIGRDKHIVEYLNIGKPIKSDKHYRFTDEEIETMWKWSANNDYVKLILMLIYSGVRPGELFALKKSSIDLEEKSFKIEKGKNNNAIRKVPIHERTLPFFINWMNKSESDYLITQLNGSAFRFDTNHKQYTDTYWRPVLSDMGILTYTNDNGETKDHTPDDTRHTFTTMWKEKKLDESMRRRIQGHSGQGIGEQVYTHFEFEKLRTELNNL